MCETLVDIDILIKRGYVTFCLCFDAFHVVSRENFNNHHVFVSFSFDIASF